MGAPGVGIEQFRQQLGGQTGPPEELRPHRPATIDEDEPHCALGDVGDDTAADLAQLVLHGPGFQGPFEAAGLVFRLQRGVVASDLGPDPLLVGPAAVSDINGPRVGLAA